MDSFPTVGDRFLPMILGPRTLTCRLIATCGHVDHGIRPLVRARWTGGFPPVGRERRPAGLTIDLGFAWTKLPVGENDVAFFYVPVNDPLRAELLGASDPVPALLYRGGPRPAGCRRSCEHRAAIDQSCIRPASRGHPERPGHARTGTRQGARPQSPAPAWRRACRGCQRGHRCRPAVTCGTRWNGSWPRWTVTPTRPPRSGSGSTAVVHHHGRATVVTCFTAAAGAVHPPAGTAAHPVAAAARISSCLYSINEPDLCRGCRGVFRGQPRGVPAGFAARGKGPSRGGPLVP